MTAENSVVPFFEAQGYTLERRAAMLSGGARLNFFSERIPIIDVFFDKLDYNHPIDYRGRLELHPYCVSLADLLLQKLQIVQINDKDLKDAMFLLLAGKVSGTDRDAVNGQYIGKVLSEDWGFYYTATTNLGKIKDAMTKVDVLGAGERQTISGRIDELSALIEAAPKSGAWKRRAKVGAKKIWYKVVTDW